MRITHGSETYEIEENDIALLWTKEKMEFSDNVKSISLPKRNYSDEVLLNFNKTKLMVAGWGLKQNLGKSITNSQSPDIIIK